MTTQVRVPIAVPLRTRVQEKPCCAIGVLLPGEYGAAVLIAVLLFSETTVAKLAAHAITPEEVRPVNDGDRA